jgi:hypothetical protein
MNDSEIREVLRVTLQMVRLQAVHADKLHRAFLALYTTVDKCLPEVEKSYLEYLAIPVDVEDITRQIQNIDALLQQLKMDGNQS